MHAVTLVQEINIIAGIFHQISPSQGWANYKNLIQNYPSDIKYNSKHNK